MARDPYRYYRVEARELLDGLAAGALVLSGASASAEEVARLLRAAHTLKGAARVVKEVATAELAHAFEEALEPLRGGAGLPVARPVVDALLGLVDAMRAQLERLSAAAADAPAAPAASPRPDPAPIQPAVAAPPPTTPEAPAAGRPDADRAAADRRQADRRRAPRRQSERNARFGTVRVELADMDRLLETVNAVAVQLEGLRREARELVDAQRALRLLARDAAARLPSQFQQLVAPLDRGCRSLAAGIERSGRGLLDAREQIDGLRLLPASMAFANLERAVHDAAGLLGREVWFSASGGEQKLEAHVLAPLSDVLLHVVRNAVDHGIEPAAERTAAGKPPAGRIELSVDSRGGRLAFRARDDGRGIDVEAVRRKALASGRLAAGQGLDMAGAIALLLRGGLSTRDDVSAVSGRGVGLDAVREVVKRLDGTLDVASEPGRGTTLEIVVPISLTRLPALLLQVSGRACSVPLASVVRALRLDLDQVTRTADGALVRDGDDLLPFARLADLLGERVGGASGGRCTAVVVQGRDGRAALAVDRIVGQTEVSLQRLPEAVGDVPLFLGASMDADGDPQIMLDADGLVQAVRAGRGAPPAAPARRRPRILVVDDSLTTRMLEQSILEAAGFEVALATSGEEGLAMARRQRYDLFISDIEMPGMSGFDFIGATRTDPKLRDTPGILVSSLHSPADKARGAEVGARAFIVKGEFEQGRFLDTIRSLVG